MVSRWGAVLRGAAATGLRKALRSASRQGTSSASRSPERSSQSPGSRSYPGDFVGRASVAYTPSPDGRADPGEIVWGWVPYEEDSTRGKDRPALVIGRDGPWVLALMLTSRDHDRSAWRDARGAVWHDIGSGDWDRQGRASEVRLDRVLRLDPDGIRREGGQLDHDRFDQVAVRLRALHGWD